jgi:predicted flap endonuclease-1-like 5' DNA nuclease
MACRESTETRLEEKKPTSPDRKPEAAQKEEFPAENAEVKPVGEPKKKRRRDRRLAAGRRRHKQKISTLEGCGPPKELAVARSGTTRRAKVARKAPIDRMYCRAAMAWQNDKRSGKKMSRLATVARRTRDTLAPNMSRHAKVARRRGHIIGNNETKSNVARGAPRGQRFQAKTEVGSGVKKEYTRQRLHPGKVRTASQTLRKTQGLDVGQQAIETSSRLDAIKNRTLWSVKRLEIAKQTNTCPVLLQRIKHWTLWKGRPPPKRKKR